MRPGNYAHERWPDVSWLIHCYKERRQGRYWRLHVGGRRVCLTKSQAELYDRLMEYMDDEYVIDVMGNGIQFHAKSMMLLIDKHKLFTLEGGKLYVLE